MSSYCLLVFDQGAQHTQNAADFATFIGLSSTEGCSAEMVTTWQKKKKKKKKKFKSKVKKYLVVEFKLSVAIIL